MNKQKQAFTLVELIVVITILAILGAIAFISLQGYSKDARNSARTSEGNMIETSLELYILKTGKYPEPTNGTGSFLMTLGTLGDSVVSNLKSISKTPVDPVTEEEYRYSVNLTRKEYNIEIPLEDGIAQNTMNQTQAFDEKRVPKVGGNFNEMYTLANDGDYYAIPSLLPEDINNPVTFVVDGEVITYTPINIGTPPTETEEYADFTRNLQTAYSGSVFQNKTIYKVLSAIDTTNTGALANFATSSFEGSSTAIVEEEINVTSWQTTGDNGNLALIDYNGLSASNYSTSTTNGAFSPTGAFDGYGNGGASAIKLNSDAGPDIVLHNVWIPNSNTNEWVGIDFGKEISITSFRMIVTDAATNLNRLPQNIIVQTSVDGTNYTNHESITLSKVANQVIPLSSILTTRYFRFYVTDNFGDTYIQIDELELYDYSGASCATEPAYLHTSFIEGAPSEVNQSWQNTDNLLPCYYTCTDGYSGADCSILPPVTTTGTYGNIALTGTNNLTTASYTASNTYYADSPESAFDGHVYNVVKINSDAGSQVMRGNWTGNGTTNMWVAVDLGVSRDISSFRVMINASTPGLNRLPKDVIIQKSSDGLTYTNHQSLTLSKTADQNVNLSSQLSTRYFRMFISNNQGDGTYTNIGELELY